MGNKKHKNKKGAADYVIPLKQAHKIGTKVNFFLRVLFVLFEKPAFDRFLLN